MSLRTPAAADSFVLVFQGLIVVMVVTMVGTLTHMWRKFSDVSLNRPYAAYLGAILLAVAPPVLNPGYRTALFVCLDGHPGRGPCSRRSSGFAISTFASSSTRCRVVFPTHSSMRGGTCSWEPTAI